MVNLNKLRGLMAEHRLTQKDLAKELGLSERTFCERMKNGNFTLGEATELIGILHIENPAAIFFADPVN